MSNKERLAEYTQECIERLGRNIREARIEENITQERLALMIGSGQSYLYRIESGRVHVGIHNLIRIADALGCAVYELVDF